jgi:hypothetical protein
MEEKDDITILPADDPDKMRLGWVIYEGGPKNKSEMNEEELDYWDKYSNPQRNLETDRADKYRDSQGEKFEDNISYCWTTKDVLEFLWGQPWNNLALNYVSTLRPSLLRVTSDGVTLECCPWRVTVWLEDDDKTIKSIEQSVTMSIVGARNASDMSMQLAYQKENGTLEGYEYPDIDGICIINDYAISKLEIDKDDEE